MGDAGALFLGYGLGVISIAGTYQHAGNLFVVLAVPLLSLGLPVLDTTFVTVMRKLNRRRISQGGRTTSATGSWRWGCRRGAPCSSSTA
jgi:UDP-GlcNAc:undecaprenyl-phosphate GlcNAc-1-phosphate transferase